MILSALLVQYFSAHASMIAAGGSIAADAAWSADTVMITDAVTVEDGVTLTISAGTLVEFQGHYALNVQGRIIALGTETDSIVFTAADTMTGWRGIRFDSTPETNDTSRITYSIIMHSHSPDAGLADESNGGGVFIKDFSNIVIANSTIAKNSCYAYGGGIYCENARPVLNDCIIDNNSARAGSGGGLHFEQAGPTVYNVIITNNSVLWNGGGVHCFRSSPRLLNCLIVGNTATRGGGICASGIYGSTISPRFYNATVADNSGSDGSGLYCSYANPDFRNTIMWGSVYLNNTSSDPRFTHCDVQGGPGSFDGSGAGSSYSGTYVNNISLTPVFVSAEDFSLQPVSPCINAGTPDTALLGLPVTDLAGNPRIYGDTIDIGAFECQEDPVGSRTRTGINRTGMAIHCTPNPFGTAVLIGFNLPSRALTTLRIYSPQGVHVSTLLDNRLESGTHQVQFDARNLPCGTYVAELEAGNARQTEPITLLK
jgi:hypothetical protein